MILETKKEVSKICYQKIVQFAVIQISINRLVFVKAVDRIATIQLNQNKESKQTMGNITHTFVKKCSCGKDVEFEVTLPDNLAVLKKHESITEKQPSSR